MNTIEARKELIDEAMKQFEKSKMMNWPWITGFYASLLKSIAADRPQDTEFLVRSLMNGMESK